MMCGKELFIYKEELEESGGEMIIRGCDERDEAKESMEYIILNG